MSTYNEILRSADSLIQQRGFLGFSYADLEKKVGIRKASIHHHFPGKVDLGIAYCEYKTKMFEQLEITLRGFPSGIQRLKAYLDAFSSCADKGEMCGVYAMLSDSHQFDPELQKAVSELAKTEMLMLKDVLISGQESGELKFVAPIEEMAIIVCSALKGALMLNRISPHNTYSRTVDALVMMFYTRS